MPAEAGIAVPGAGFSRDFSETLAELKFPVLQSWASLITKRSANRRR